MPRKRPPVNNNDDDDTEEEESEDENDFQWTNAVDKTLIAAGSAITGAGAVQLLKRNKNVEHGVTKAKLAYAEQRAKNAETLAASATAQSAINRAQSFRTADDLARDLAYERWKTGGKVLLPSLLVGGALGARLRAKWSNISQAYTEGGLGKSVYVYLGGKPTSNSPRA